MLSARADTLRRQSFLAVSLSWVAGYVNVVSLVALGYTVSHHTGNTTYVAMYLLDRHWAMATSHAMVLTMFFAGAAISGWLLSQAERAAGRSKYIAPIAAEAGLLAVLSVSLLVWMRRPHAPGAAIPVELLWLGAMAMGLQNATITRISGSVVRTTHLTGVITDLGLEGAQLISWWRERTRSNVRLRYARTFQVMGRQPAFTRLALLASIFGSFLCGALAGAFLIIRIPSTSLFLPTAFLVCLVVRYGIYSRQPATASGLSKTS